MKKFLKCLALVAAFVLIASCEKPVSPQTPSEPDTITIVGTRDDFKGDPQVGGPAFLLSIVK